MEVHSYRRALFPMSTSDKKWGIGFLSSTKQQNIRLSIFNLDLFMGICLLLLFLVLQLRFILFLIKIIHIRSAHDDLIYTVK